MFSHSASTPPPTRHWLPSSKRAGEGQKTGTASADLFEVADVPDSWQYWQERIRILCRVKTHLGEPAD
jgi:hypothetical protein